MDGARWQYASTRVDVTPPLGMKMGGYAARGDRGAEAIEAPLFADTLVLAQGEERIVLVTADLIAIDERWGDHVRAGIADRLQIPASHIVLLASHTHFGPETRLYSLQREEDRAWIESTADKLIEAAASAADRLQPASLHVGFHDAGAMMYNRRLRRPDGTCRTVYVLPLPEPDLSFGPTDPRLTALRIADVDGNALANFVSVGIHPVVGGADFYAISPDYVGTLRSVLEHAYEAPTHFALGTAGNVVPLRRGIGEREKLGRYLAGAALAALETTIPVEGPLTLARREVQLPASNRPTADEGARLLAEAKAELSEAEASGERRRIARAHDDLRRIESLIDAAKELGPGDTMKFYVTAIGLGSLGIVCLPGEIFAETGLVIQDRSPYPHTLVLSLADQSTGYLPTRPAFWEGGYEYSVTLMNEESEAAAVDLAVALLHEAWEAGLSTGGD